MERAAKDVKIQIFSARDGRKACSATGDHQTPYNIITKACIERLQQPWTRLRDDVKCKINRHASPPIGFSELTWNWEGFSTTWRNQFIVVEIAPWEVILGSGDCQKPRTSRVGLYPYELGKQSKEDEEEERRKAQQAEQRNAVERAQQDAKNKENREKAKKARKDKDRNT